MKKTFLITVLSLLTSIFVNAQLPKSAKAVKPLLVGDKVPNVTITTSTNGDISTKKLFNKQQTVLVIYRGGWCPFCNLQLSGLGEVKDDLIGMGYQIVAVSPDSQSYSESQKYAENYIIGSDTSTELIQKLGIAYQAPSKYSKILKKASKGKNTSIIPAPSVFILNTNGEILFEHVSTNFKERISSQLVSLIADAYKE